jgi:hypothetical protein
MARCASCNGVIFFGKKEGDLQFCNQTCMEFFAAPNFCQNCVDETTPESPRGTYVINGVGTRIYGNRSKCPNCFSVIKKKWFCIVYIPVIPLGTYRIKPVTVTRYLGRKLKKPAK